MARNTTQIVNKDILDIIRQVHETNIMTYVVTTGSGGPFISWLMSVEKCSKTLVEGIITYMRSSTLDFVNDLELDLDFVSSDMARLLVTKAYEKGKRLLEIDNKDVPFIAIACTGSIKTFYDKKGPHHAYFCSFDGQNLEGYYVKFCKNLRSRMEEDYIVCLIMLKILCKFAQIPCDLALGLEEGDTYNETLSIQQENKTIPMKCNTCYTLLKIYDYQIGTCEECMGVDKCRSCKKELNSKDFNRNICKKCWKKSICIQCKRLLNEKEIKYGNCICNGCWDHFDCLVCGEDLSKKRKRFPHWTL